VRRASVNESIAPAPGYLALTSSRHLGVVRVRRCAAGASGRPAGPLPRPLLGERGLAEATMLGHVDVARPGIAAACVVT